MAAGGHFVNASNPTSQKMGPWVPSKSQRTCYSPNPYAHIDDAGVSPDEEAFIFTPDYGQSAYESPPISVSPSGQPPHSGGKIGAPPLPLLAPMFNDPKDRALQAQQYPISAQLISAQEAAAKAAQEAAAKAAQEVLYA